MHSLPKDFQKAILSSPKAKKVWETVTPLAKNEWICWVTSGKKAETRDIRIKKGISKLRGGMRLEFVCGIRALRDRHSLRLFMRRDRYGRFASCLVYLPRDRYTTQVRLRIEKLLVDALGGVSVDYTARVSESVLARLHFVIHVPLGQGLPDIDLHDLEARVASATRSWQDEFTSMLASRVGDAAASPLLRTYAHAFPEAGEDAPHAQASSARSAMPSDRPRPARSAMKAGM